MNSLPLINASEIVVVIIVSAAFLQDSDDIFRGQFSEVGFNQVLHKNVKSFCLLLFIDLHFQLLNASLD